MIRIPLFIAVALVILTTAPSPEECIANSPAGIKIYPNRPSDTNVLHAGFSPLGRLNNSLPPWLCFNAGYRARAEGVSGGNFLANDSDSYLLTRFRLGALLKPASWLHVYAELQDATAFGKNPPIGPPFQSTWDLRRAYVDLGDLERDSVGFVSDARI
jgi:hypothetical protein